MTIFQLEDDHSRYILGSHVEDSENSGAVAVLKAAVAAHQAPVLLLTDNGLAMNPHRRGVTSQLAAYAASLGIRAITGRVYHPQTTGKNERLHQTLKRWLTARPAPTTLEQLRDWLTEFDSYYNQRRPHQALQLRTPGHVLTTGPRAAPPEPPEPAQEPGTQATATLKKPPRQRDPLRRIRVMRNGSVRTRGIYIGLGVEHAGGHVLVMTNTTDTTTTISIFDLLGTELRTVQPIPGKTYYGTGRPRGGPHRPRPHEKLTPHPLSGPN